MVDSSELAWSDVHEKASAMRRSDLTASAACIVRSACVSYTSNAVCHVRKL